MLDVHPPEHPAHSWTDFFIHIATIVVGLLIAVGLEQTVEYFHHRYEVRETREALARERETNRTKFANRCRYWHINTAVLQNNLLVVRYLQEHPGTPQEKLPGVLEWRHVNVGFDSSAWSGAQTSGVLPLMPQEEATRDASLYNHLQDVESSNQTWQLLLSSHQFAISDPDPSHLSPAQIASEIDLLQKALVVEFDQAVKLYNLPKIAPDFPACVTRDDLDKIYQVPDPQSTAGPHAETEKRLRAAGWTPLTLTPNGWVATAAAAPAPAKQP
jgi:hypothetical protein